MSTPVPIGRYAVTAVLAVAGLVGIMLLVRPFIFTFAGPRDDSNYPVLSALEADEGPQIVEIVLSDPHGLLGEMARDDQVGLTVAVAPLPGGDGYSVVSAWSPTNDCPVTIAGDRLADCGGDAWTFAGVPIDPADPQLQGFAAEERNGAVVVDFTAPLPAS